MPKESVIETEVCKHAKKKGWLVYKFVSPGISGVPDRLFIRDGNVFFIEFKSPNGKTSILQDVVIGKIQDQKVNVYIVDDIGQGIKIIEKETLKTRTT